LALLPAVVLWAAYNHVRFGAPWRTGYGGQKFNHPFVRGLVGLLVSPAHGFLIYVPLVFVAAVGFRVAWRRAPVIALVAAGLIVVRILFYARWWAWYGGGSWGSRFMAAVTPALAIGVIEVIRSWHKTPRRWQASILAIVFVSASVQVIGGAVDPKHSALHDRLVPIVFGHPGRPILEAAATADAERRIDKVFFSTEAFPISDEATRLVHGEDLAGRFTAPRAQPWTIALVFLTAISASAGGLLAARSTDRRPRSGRSGVPWDTRPGP
jgi:hypothetical protein